MDPHVNNIQQPQAIYGTNGKNVHDFYEIVPHNVQLLDTMAYLKENEEMVRLTLDKLLHVKKICSCFIKT